MTDADAVPDLTAFDDPAERAAALAAALGESSLPTDGDGPAFAAPWQARVFALAVALGEAEGFDWGRLQERLAGAVAGADPERLDGDIERVYYQRWLAALEAALVEEGVLTPAELRRRKAAFAAGERDASEFVVESSG